MGKLIDADALIAKITDFACKPCIEKGRNYGGVRCRACQYGDEIEDIESAEELDAIPVVRCKDCKYNESGTYAKWIYCWCRNTLMSPNGFCSRGERKDDA